MALEVSGSGYIVGVSLRRIRGVRHKSLQLSGFCIAGPCTSSQSLNGEASRKDLKEGRVPVQV